MKNIISNINKENITTVAIGAAVVYGTVVAVKLAGNVYNGMKEFNKMRKAKESK